MDAKSRTRVVGYTRASTTGQEITVEAQAERIRAYCVTYDLELVALIADPAASAKDLRSRRKGDRDKGFANLVAEHRPKLAEALRYLDSGRADGIVIAKLDRLTRSIRDLGDLLSNYFEDGRFALLSVGDQIDTRTATGRFVLNLLGSIAQWERETIVERTKAALAYKRAKREFCGGFVPYGWELLPDGVHIAPHTIEQYMIKAARELRSHGLSLRAVGAQLESSGFKARGGRWHAKTVRDLINAEVA